MNRSLFFTAIKEYGVKEIEGPDSNPRILQYASQCGMNYIKSDETAWCSIFVNWCCAMNGYERSNKLNARSWLDIGKNKKDPEIGDIAVFWRVSPTDWRGHVGIFLLKRNDLIYVLGGNQNNMVCIKPYPERRLLGYREVFANLNRDRYISDTYMR